MMASERRFTIFRISLYKTFREIGKENLPKATWRVFGYYDAMSIDEIPWSSCITPLDAIYQDADRITRRNSGCVKEHVLYAFSFREDNGQEFIRKSCKQPVFLVSLIHLNHPFRSNTAFRSQTIPRIKGKIECELRSDSNISCLVSVSLDCNDLIVFWSGDSISGIMQRISAISTNLQEYICEVFTIQACNQIMLIKAKSRLLTRWKAAEESFTAVNIYLQGPNHGDLIQKAHLIQDEYQKLPDDKRPKVSILSGSDDIVLRFKEIAIEDFVQLYRESRPSEIAQILNDLVSRTIIEIPLPEDADDLLKRECPPRGRLPYPVPELLEKFKVKYKKLDEAEQAQMIWAAPLLELLIELSNIQVSNTAYDIFAQAAKSQMRFINKLCDLLEDPVYRSILLNPDSKTVQFIQRYIQGWSQLSFHAMHSEWQLTQTSDVNRLYLFPAKLNRLYCAFMKQSSLLLSDGSHRKEAPDKNEICYFLTPKICSDAEFISIFRECGDISSIILGEIPADMVFSPQILLPILIHEAGHYVGGNIRKREERYDRLLSSSMQFVFQTLFSVDLLTECDGAGTPLIYTLVAEWKNLLQEKNEFWPEDLYGVHATKHIKRVLIATIFDHLDMVNRFAWSAIEKNRRYQLLSRSLQVLKAEEIFYSERVIDLIDMGDPGSLSEFVDQLINIYREAFCDLCMIKSLDMKCGDYLNVICRSYRLNEPFGQRERKIIYNMICWERIISVVETVWCKKNGDMLREDADTLLSSSYCSDRDQACVRALLDELYRILEQTDMAEGEECLINMYWHGCLKDYLRIVSAELEDVIKKNNDDFGLLRRVYASLSHDCWFCENGADNRIQAAFQDFQKLIQTAEKGDKEAKPKSK